MDPELEDDLIEALNGVDPLELLLEDPALCQVAGQVLSSLEHGLSGFEELSEPCESIKSPLSVESDASEPDRLFMPSPSNPRKTESSSFVKYAVNRANCDACQRPARGYRYYGAVVCNSCRAFFSRATKGDSHLNFTCAQVNLGAPCSISTKAWNICQKCRFDHCIRIGMKLPNRSKKTKQVVANTSQTTQFCWDLEPVQDALRKTRTLLGPATSLTMEEKLYLEALVSSQMKKGCEDVACLAGNNMDIFRANMEFFYHGKTYPLLMEKRCEDYMSYSASRSFENDSKTGLHSIKLKQKDRNRLLHANYPLVLEFLLTCKLNNEISSRDKDIESYFEIVKSNNADPEYRRTINNIHSQVRKKRS